ncbi:MAG: hypothetical protein V4568_14625 [Pseudomonadota bacterium]
MKPYEERLSDARGIYAQGLRSVAETPAPKGQKFPVGAFVKIAADLGPMMSHFPSDRYARVEYTYAHAYPHFGGSDKDYSLLVQRDDGRWSSSAWYRESQLTEVTDAAQLAALRTALKAVGVEL